MVQSTATKFRVGCRKVWLQYVDWIKLTQDMVL